MTSNAAGDFLLEVRKIDARPDETLLLEAYASDMPRDPLQLLLGQEETLGIGRVISVRRGTCAENSPHPAAGAAATEP